MWIKLKDSVIDVCGIRLLNRPNGKKALLLESPRNSCYIYDDADNLYSQIVDALQRGNSFLELQCECAWS